MPWPARAFFSRSASCRQRPAPPAAWPYSRAGTCAQRDVWITERLWWTPKITLPCTSRTRVFRQPPSDSTTTAADPRILPEGHRRKTVVGQDNFLPGFDFVYEHCLSSPTYFNYLRQKGYPESVCNRQAICTPDAPEDAPADRLPCSHPAHYKAEDSEGQFITTKAVDYIEENRGTGWFLNLNYVKPHPPFICPAPYHAMYDPAPCPRPRAGPKNLLRPFRISAGSPSIAGQSSRMRLNYDRFRHVTTA